MQLFSGAQILQKLKQPLGYKVFGKDNKAKEIYFGGASLLLPCASVVLSWACDSCEPELLFPFLFLGIV